MTKITEQRLSELNCSTITDREIRKLVKAYRKAKYGGKWIEWKGGECPVEGSVMVEVKYRDGKNNVPYRMPNKELAGKYHWYDTGVCTDIIAYRAVPE